MSTVEETSMDANVGSVYYHPPIMQGGTERELKDIETGQQRKPVRQAILVGTNQETKSNRTECAICLEEFEEEDNWRVLFQCKHKFHKLCIHQWLVKHENCPLCRSCVQDLEPTTEIVGSS
ncbi:Uncharacterized protein TCM_041929 [Theobroma cacao]|uniref:RING-type domain-containing protein n=1 Tax=Theobroma cacao TaxID=3641 RepID=A0A061GYC1_THECC|nr:Uncharacterized protein TCM_041929 [Theobroma cacao]